MEDGEKLEAPLKFPRYRGNGMYERYGSELERPYLPPIGKQGTYKRR